MVGDATPRISAAQLEEFVNQRVRIVGKVLQLRGDTATIDAQGPITINLAPDSHLAVNNAAEVIGKIRADHSVQVMQATDFGSNFDYDAANAVVAATHKYKEIFYDPSAASGGQGQGSGGGQGW